jgi:general secretion pathway protein B
MSFILDALKKSETDRQRQTGPALFEVKVPPPRNGLPLWAVGLAVLLAVNLVIVAWVLLRRPTPAEVATSAQSPLTTSPAPAAPAMTPPAGLQGQAIAPATQTPLAQTAPMPQPAAPQPQQTTGASVAPNSTNAASAPAQTDARGESPNPDDYAPAADPPPSSSFGNPVTRTTASGLPLYRDPALASAHIPELRLDLHAYASKPQERFVMINMQKLHEGDSLTREGVRVVSITPEGAVLSHNGTQFLLPRD